MRLADAVETAVFVHLEGLVTSTGHTLTTSYEGRRLHVAASKGHDVVATYRLELVELECDPDEV